MAKYVTDTGEGGSDKQKKKGFKVDRRANYEKTIKRKHNIKTAPEAKPAGRVKRIDFDGSALKDYVLSLHKNKNERRVKAFVDVKRRLRRESAKVRRDQREEARKAYNQYAKVPILPNYKFQLPSPAEQQQQHSYGSDDESDDGEVEKRYRRELLLQEHSHHSIPSAMLQGGEKSSCKATGAGKPGTATTLQDFYNKQDAAHPAAATAASSSVIVDVTPLSDHLSTSSHLPASVEEALRQVRKEAKGPSQTRAKVKTLKELEKIRKIKRHSRKGHGKKSASGKRKNRK